MKRRHPLIIKEGKDTYRLGEFRGGLLLYDFEGILNYLEARGKMLFGSKFRIYPKNHTTLYKLSVYLIRDTRSCKRLGIDPDKGILLSGPKGCGKSCLIKLIRHLIPGQRLYELIPCHNIVFGFNCIGDHITRQYEDDRLYCFDNLGSEPMGNYAGDNRDVMGDILLIRNRLFRTHRVKCFATTRLTARDLEARYGHKVYKGMRELFNLITFNKGNRNKP
ncbi:ATPase [Galbibacter pacificus]|uniref:ATPase n=1 Tax=Galbibacter pacificus TaxID=2996052 RepID=A0ABT6FN83_9FLAO|nr:ATPase [Galbibacter pacificus]MDG3581249.1 ATPase [Galbibacter pacificus]MDG3584727.1 ATPase [Galbibacter pacificus]